MVFNLENYLTSDISLSVIILRVVQGFQAVDILLLLLGKTKGNLLASFFQILGRNFVALFVIEYGTNQMVFAGVVIVWSIADANRYLYYLYKNNPITGFLRYNSFLILYPLGGVAETLVFNNYFQRHPEIPELHYYFFRTVNVIIILAIILLYTHMLKSRKRFYQAKK